MAGKGSGSTKDSEGAKISEGDRGDKTGDGKRGDGEEGDGSEDGVESVIDHLQPIVVPA